MCKCLHGPFSEIKGRQSLMLICYIQLVSDVVKNGQFIIMAVT